MLVKLIDLGFNRPQVVRTAFLHAYEEFEFHNVEAGSYDIRYQDLDSGVISKSQPFSLSQSAETHSTTFRLTLYTVAGWNTNAEVIGPDEF